MPEVNIPGVGIVHFPYDMPADQIAAQARRLHDEAQGKEPSLTRERQAPDTPSALASGHHPDTQSVTYFGKTLPTGGPKLRAMIAEGAGPSDADFLNRGPEVGGTAGMILAGPIGAGLGAAAGSLAKGQAAQGAHVPTRGDLGQAAVQGGTSLALSAIPGLSRVAAERVGPALTNNAPRISRAIRGATGAGPMAGLGAGIATGNPIAGAATAAATRAVTSPAAIRAAGNAATSVGNVPMHVVNKTGFGLLSVDALLKALAEEPEQP